MRAMWTGAVSFGLVSVPVKLYSATENHDVRFHQVHGADGGRIRYKRVCEVCGNEVEYADIVKGFETEDGELITLDEADLESLPAASGNREIDVMEFVPSDEVDPLLLDRSYFLEPDSKAAKPYALLREALRTTDRMALVKVAIRSRETLALLRVRDKVIVLQTMLWPDEVRTPEFDILDAEVELRPQEMQMASSLVDSMGAEFDPSRFTDEYRDAMIELIDRKRSTGDTREAPVAADSGSTGADSMTDLLTALQRSVEAAKAGSSGTGAGAGGSAGAAKVPAQRSGAADDPEPESAGGTKTATKAPAKAPAKSKAEPKADTKSESTPKPRTAGKGTKRPRRTA
ncbi:non-homologous end joining protein Ku [Pseudonocardia sp. Cha107L01]|uniref:non-homologous end joining protein Ku n=1 Tax=Pseudonocardia sp. Cha107L01 TaxID=3457576 RepID=UPI00403ED9EF